ncbi:MAG: sugar phosphate isomerase/epimerase family protein [Phototrophicaceae bacterium]
MNNLPTIGAAMPSAWLDTYQVWLIEGQRDLEIQDFSRPDILDDSNLSNHLADIKSKLDGYVGRMGIHAPFWNLDLAAYDLKIRAVVQDRFKQSLDVAAEIGATHMVIHSPLSFLGAPNSLIKPMIANKPLFEMVHETLEPVLTRAEQIDCTLVIENIFDKNPIMLTDLVKSFNSSFVRQSLDVGHAYINHCEGAVPPDYYVRVAGALLSHVHLQDTDGYTDRHWAIGEGKVDWVELFRALGEVDNEPRLILELKDCAAIPSATKWLQEQSLAE